MVLAYDMCSCALFALFIVHRFAINFISVIPQIYSHMRVFFIGSNLHSYLYMFVCTLKKVVEINFFVCGHDNNKMLIIHKLLK